MSESSRAKVLLIAEDQLLLAVAIKDELEDHGYRVLEIASRNQEAMNLARQVKPDLALVNIELAQGDSGIALAGDLTTMGVPVLFISGQSERAKSARTAGVASLPKPYTPRQLVEAVDYLFRYRHGDRSQQKPPRLEMFDADCPAMNPN